MLAIYHSIYFHFIFYDLQIHPDNFIASKNSIIVNIVSSSSILYIQCQEQFEDDHILAVGYIFLVCTE